MNRTSRILFVLCVISPLPFCGDPVVAQDDVQKLADLIDELIARKWAENSVVPASASDDSEYLGRVWLDIAGKIPTAAEAQDFLDDTAIDKRRRVVDELLDGPNYVVNWSNVWRRVLIPEADSDFNIRYMLPGFEAWLRQQLDENASYDDFVREILTTPVSGVNPYQSQNGLTPFASQRRSSPRIWPPRRRACFWEFGSSVLSATIIPSIRGKEKTSGDTPRSLLPCNGSRAAMDFLDSFRNYSSTGR